MTPEPPFHVVFLEPEIPQNSGTTGRLCAATDCVFHLVGTLGFSLEDRYLKRAGLDYWPHLRLQRHASWEDYEASSDGARRFYFSTRGQQSYTDIAYRPGDHLVFGGESKGLPDRLLAANPDRCLRIPMPGPVRSLNLANTAAIAVYEGLRQLGRT